MTDRNQQEQIDAVVRRLASVAEVSPLALEDEVKECFREWDDARVRDFVPIFVERALKARLRVRS